MAEKVNDCGGRCLCAAYFIDGMYYEITHNGDKNETYVDVYKKWENLTVKKQIS